MFEWDRKKADAVHGLFLNKKNCLHNYMYSLNSQRKQINFHTMTSSASVLYFENQETWLREETRRTWQFRSVYLTTASGVQQRENTLEQEKGVPHFMSSMKHLRNFALSEVKNSLKLLSSTDFRFCCVRLH